MLQIPLGVRLARRVLSVIPHGITVDLSQAPACLRLHCRQDCRPAGATSKSAPSTAEALSTSPAVAVVTAGVVSCTDFLVGLDTAGRLVACCFGAACLLAVLEPARFARGALALLGLFAGADLAARLRGRGRLALAGADAFACSFFLL